MTYESLLKSWGEPGTEWQDGWAFAKDEPLPAEWGNYLIDNLITDVQHLVDLTNTIDPDNDGTVVNADKVDGLHADQLGGFKFSQAATPSNVTEGVSWYKNSNGLLYIGNGNKLEPQPAIGYDECAGFDYSSRDAGYAIIHEPAPRTEIKNGLIKLVDETVIADFETNTRFIYPWDWESGFGNVSLTTATVLEGTQSAKIESVAANTSAIGAVDVPIVRDWHITFQPGADTSNTNDFQAIEVHNENGSRIASIKYVDGIGNVEVISGDGTTEIEASWSEVPAAYEFDWNFDAGSFDLYRDGSLVGTFSFENPSSAFGKFSIINETSGSAVTRSCFFDDIRVGAAEYGETVIVGPNPDERIRSWDIIQLDKTLDGESVVVDVEDESENTLLSDISSNEDISAVANSDTNIKLRVKISRANITNNPTLDSVLRRWTMRPGDTDLSNKEKTDLFRNNLIANQLYE